MRTIIRSLLLIVLAGTLAAQAEVVKVKGKGEIEFQGTFKQGSPEELAAITAAKKNAVTRYAGDFDSARLALYKKIEPDVLANIDQYVTDYTQLDEQVDKDTKHVTVVIEATINPGLIENAIQKNTTTTAPTADANASAKTSPSYMTFLFVARELASRKDFDAKRTTVDINESSQAGAQKNKIAEDAQSAETSVDKTSVVKQTTGGNVETKAEELAYRVSVRSRKASHVRKPVNASNIICQPRVSARMSENISAAISCNASVSCGMNSRQCRTFLAQQYRGRRKLSGFCRMRSHRMAQRTALLKVFISMSTARSPRPFVACFLRHAW